jgi:hypothetical protein
MEEKVITLSSIFDKWIDSTQKFRTGKATRIPPPGSGKPGSDLRRCRTVRQRTDCDDVLVMRGD